MRAVQGKAQEGQSALAELCRLYWYPLYVFARLSGHSPVGAQDLMQGFFLHLLEHRAPAGANRLKGKFRSFLLASLQSYLSDELERARCHKEEETKNSYTWMQKRPKNAIGWSRSSS
jgi:DNA-directed RNA polymerase specialized sigma24 family protein